MVFDDFEKAFFDNFYEGSMKLFNKLRAILN